MSDYIGKEINGLTIMEQIGAGGMAVVFKAYQPAFDRFVALKLLQEAYADEEVGIQRFIQEAKIIANLEHRHILPVYDFGEFEQTAYLTMRYLQAGTLNDLLQNAPNHQLPLADTLRIISQIAGALAVAHENGIVHRDVKPSNILIDKQGDAYLTDFGIAKILDATSHFTKTGGSLGTPAYMSPEQGKNQQIDARTDVYALGIILYELLVGRVPYRKDTPVATMLAHVTEVLPPPRSLNPDISEAIEQIVLKALQKNPVERYQSMTTFIQALEKAMGSSALVEASTQFLALTQELATDKPAEDLTIDDRRIIQRQARRKQLRRMTPYLIGVTALVVVAVLVGLLINNQAAGENLAQAQLTRTAVFEVNQDATELANLAATQAAITPSATVTQDPTATATVPPTPTPLLVEITDDFGHEMVLIPAGEFLMGSEDGEVDEAPVHTVYLDDYYIDKYEVTLQQYADYLNQQYIPLSEDPFSYDREILGHEIKINRNETGQWVVEGLFQDYPYAYGGTIFGSGSGYCQYRGATLPTEAQWEKAARGTEGFIYPWGNEFNVNFANGTGTDDGYTDTAPVGSYPEGVSPYGLFDMAGNVYEQVLDLYASDYYNSSPFENPLGPRSGQTTVIRGGYWGSNQLNLRITNRTQLSYTEEQVPIGFRCVWYP